MFLEDSLKSIKKRNSQLKIYFLLKCYRFLYSSSLVYFCMNSTTLDRLGYLISMVPPYWYDLFSFIKYYNISWFCNFK